MQLIRELIMAEAKEDDLAVSTSNKTSLSSVTDDLNAISTFTDKKTGGKVGDPNTLFTE